MILMMFLIKIKEHFVNIFVKNFKKINFLLILLSGKSINKKAIFTVGISWPIMMTLNLYAYQLGKVSIIAPLCSLVAILNVIVGYIFLKERTRLPQKLIAAILIVIGIVLIKL